jgi:hypothetical protein
MPLADCHVVRLRRTPHNDDPQTAWCPTCLQLGLTVIARRFAEAISVHFLLPLGEGGRRPEEGPCLFGGVLRPASVRVTRPNSAPYARHVPGHENRLPTRLAVGSLTQSYKVPIGRRRRSFVAITVLQSGTTRTDGATAWHRLAMRGPSGSMRSPGLILALHCPPRAWPARMGQRRNAASRHCPDGQGHTGHRAHECR